MRNDCYTNDKVILGQHAVQLSIASNAYIREVDLVLNGSHDYFFFSDIWIIFIQCIAYGIPNPHASIGVITLTSVNDISYSANAVGTNNESHPSVRYVNTTVKAVGRWKQYFWVLKRLINS